MDLGLKDRIALVTGSSRGLGKAIALALAREGCRVAICARGEEDLQGTLREIEALGTRGLAVLADVTDASAAEVVIGRVVEEWEGLDILVNNAGGGGGRVAGSIEDVPMEVWERTLDLNAGTAIRFIRRALPLMRRTRWGRVVTVASKHGREGGGRPWYTMSKSSQIALMKTLAMQRQLVRDGITFNSVAPGAILAAGNAWEAFQKEDPDGFQRRADGVPLGRLGRPEEIGAVVAFLCSEPASLINGACLPVDGGESKAF